MRDDKQFVTFENFVVGKNTRRSPKFKAWKSLFSMGYWYEDQAL